MNDSDIKNQFLQAGALLSDYLSDFPEHAQGDYRVWAAYQVLDRAFFDMYGEPVDSLFQKQRAEQQAYIDGMS